MDERSAVFVMGADLGFRHSWDLEAEQICDLAERGLDWTGISHDDSPSMASILQDIFLLLYYLCKHDVLSYIQLTSSA